MNASNRQAAGLGSIADVEAARREGLSLAAYARAHGLSVTRLYRISKRLRRLGQPATPKRERISRKAKPVEQEPMMPFAQVQVSALRSSRLLAQLPNGATVELDCTAGDVSLMSALIETLGQCHVPARR